MNVVRAAVKPDQKRSTSEKADTVLLRTSAVHTTLRMDDESSTVPPAAAGRRRSHGQRVWVAADDTVQLRH